MFVTFEGPEGSGKSTQIERVAARLRDAGKDVITTREPGGTALGEALRTILLDATHLPTPETEAYLMTGARAEHIRRVIRPALERGALVLCDRYLDSTLAYQGAGRGIDVDVLRDLQDLATGGLLPDRTLLLDLDVEEGLRRRGSSGDRNRIDDETVSFHHRVADWYRAEAARCPGRWSIVDAGQDVESVTRDILKVLSVATRQSSVVV